MKRCPICLLDYTGTEHDTAKCFKLNELKQFATAERIRRTNDET